MNRVEQDTRIDKAMHENVIFYGVCVAITCIANCQKRSDSFGCRLHLLQCFFTRRKK